MKLVTTFFFFISFSLSAQIKGVVVDEIDKPIPYVNIWVQDENIGSTTEENGTFTLNTEGNKNLIFSAIGYKKLVTLFKEKIILEQETYKLDEVIVSSLKLTKEIEIGDSKRFHHKHLSGDKPWIYGKLFTYEPKYSETPYLKNIVFLSDSEKKDAKLKIRIFKLKDSLPDEDLIFEDVFVTVKKGMRKNVVDISKYKIIMPNNGIIIGLEFLIIEENKYVYEYSYNKIKHSTINYAPSLVINYSNEENSFRFSGGKWYKNKIIDFPGSTNKPYYNKVMTPAINLILTN